MNYLILIFQSTHHVLKAEKVLLSNGIKLDIIPTPKDITSECGVSIRINPLITDKQHVASLLNDCNIAFELFEKEMQ
jgi:hypothetical protein